MIYFYFFYKAIFVTTIINPHNKLNESIVKLKEKEREMIEILDNMHVGIAIFDNESKISFANSVCLDLLKTKKNDFLGLSSKQVMDNYSGDKSAINIIDPLMKNDYKTIKIVRSYKTTKSEELKLSVEAIKVKNGVQVILTDARKEQELDDIRLQTQAVLNSIDNLVLLLDTRYNVIMCNDALSNAVEMDKNDILKQNVFKLKKLLNSDLKYMPNLKTPYSNPFTKNYNADFTTNSGKKVNLIIYFSSVKNIDNEIIGLIAVGTDITKLLEEQQMQQQQEKLALIGQLGSGIVHETKNYLSAIKGYCQLMTLKISDDAVKKQVKRIENITDDVNRVIMDFLTFAKPSSSVHSSISLNGIVESMKFLFDSLCYNNKINLEFNLTHAQTDIFADETQLKHVVLNIVKNAVEALSETEKPLLSINTELMPGDNKVVLRITDNGKGISKEVLEKLGTPFFTTKDKGTGLGLSLCYRIVSEHSGNIDIKSKEGEGTTFTISFPSSIKSV
ncbi:MAG: ATP-binding protein [Bacillota bacterium]|nr:ATP-binding protein [Bacillota bacterium]